MQLLKLDWLVGLVLSENITTPWLHLASWNLPNYQINWESKMEPSVAKTENMCQLDPSGRCHPEVHPKYLISTQKWAWKSKKKAGNGQNCTAKFSPKKLFFPIFSLPIFLACPRCTFWTPNFYGELWFHRDLTKTDLPLFKISGNFPIDQNMIEANAQYCAKTKGPKIKMHKINIEVHGLRTNFHLSILI